MKKYEKMTSGASIMCFSRGIRMPVFNQGDLSKYNELESTPTYKKSRNVKYDMKNILVE